MREAGFFHVTFASGFQPASSSSQTTVCCSMHYSTPQH